MNRPSIFALFFSIGIVTLASAACSGRDRNLGAEPSSDFLPVDAGQLDAPASCTGLRCSRDLKKVVDGCTDAVITECGPDQGCANGACVDPCAAADASKGSAGCAFWTLPPDEPDYGPGSCFAAMIANTWDRPVNITAEYGTTPLDLSGSVFTAEVVGTNAKYTKLEGPLPPGEVALVFLSEIRPTPPPDPAGRQNFSACPLGIVGALNADPIAHGTAITKAFSIKTDAPVSAYSIYPYGGAKTFIPSATLLWPTSAWSTNYIAVSGWPQTRDHYDNPLGDPTIQIVATSDDTEVRMRPTADVSDGVGVLGTGAGTTATWKLARGEVLQITQPHELTGSAIETSKAVGVFGGSKCTYVPTAVSACDTLQQQIPPLQQWGSDYALLPYKGRFGTATEQREIVPYRLVGAVDGTVLSYDPQKPRDAPAVLRAGQVAMFMTDELVTVKSQDSEHPFYASVMMTGALFNGTLTDGDPDFVNVVPSDQFLDRYIFFADYTYPETTLTLVRRKTPKGFMPVEIDCLGEVPNFRPVGDAGEYEYAWIDLTTGFAPASGTCTAGRHEAKSEGPFSLTVWGMGYCASYGYPGGGGSRPLTKAQVPVR